MSYTNFDFPHTNFYETDLRELIRLVKILKEAVENLEDWREQHEKEYEELKDLYDAVMNGNFPPSIVQAFEDWMSRNALNLVGSLVKHVYFGLTNDGYFCAYIPENWSDISFDTVSNFDDPLFGHLMLMYD
jgi:uncharacterized protein YfkK (UPF0435 family)